MVLFKSNLMNIFFIDSRPVDRSFTTSPLLAIDRPGRLSLARSTSFMAFFKVSRVHLGLLCTVLEVLYLASWSKC